MFNEVMGLKRTISALHSSDVDAFFSRLGLLEAFAAGALTCHVCGSVLTAQTFRAVGRRGRDLHFVCTRQDCVTAFIEAPPETPK